MIEEIATVVAAENEGVWLTTKVVSTCHSCQANDTCGTGMLARAFTSRPSRFFVNTDRTLLPGERVKIALAEQGLLKAAFMVYVLPLLLITAVIMIAQLIWQPPEPVLILLAIAGGVAGFLLARLYNHWLSLQPDQIIITDVLPQLGLHVS